MADNENTSTETEETAPQPEEAVDAVAPGSTEVADDEAETGDKADDEAAAETPAEPEPQPEAEPEHEPEPELPRFAAPFSSPEPTAVVARPRRRATRTVIAADPDSVEAPAPAPVS